MIIIEIHGVSGKGNWVSHHAKITLLERPLFHARLGTTCIEVLLTNERNGPFNPDRYAPKYAALYWKFKEYSTIPN